MADDASPSATARSWLRHDSATSNGTSTAMASSSGVSTAPPGHALRRARTASEAISSPRVSGRGGGPRQSSTTTATAAASSSTQRCSADPTGSSVERAPRRSSNFSEYSFGEARNILNPQRSREAAADDDDNNVAEETVESEPPSSSLARLSLAFALLPAVAGALFTNGGAVTTDIMLLGLAGVFLHWSVTQPWLWYHSAQQVRVHHEEIVTDQVMECDSDEESFADGVSHLDDVSEEQDGPHTSTSNHAEPDKTTTTTTTASMATWSEKQQSALSELYMHEVVALLSCFSLPLVSAYMLHLIRSQLSRPSEGLVSNYNLTIFILVSEVRVLSHLIRLVQARTLHLQRIVHSSPYSTLPSTNSARIEAVLERLDALETGMATRDKDGVVVGEEEKKKKKKKKKDEGGEDEKGSENDDGDGGDREGGGGGRAVQNKEALAREVRNAIQPELDALNRAVRRYEKKSTLLQSHVDAHLAAVEVRVGDAIALAAAAAKNHGVTSGGGGGGGTRQGGRSILVRVLEGVVGLAVFPFRATVRLVVLPVGVILGWMVGAGGSRHGPDDEDDGRKSKRRARPAAGGKGTAGHSLRGAGKRAAGSRGEQMRYGAGDKVGWRVVRKMDG